MREKKRRVDSPDIYICAGHRGFTDGKMSLKERERKRDRWAMTDRQNGKSKMTGRKREGKKGEEKRLNLFAKKNGARKKMKKR